VHATLELGATGIGIMGTKWKLGLVKFLESRQLGEHIVLGVLHGRAGK
jgi:hypothetical protein